MTKTKKTRYNFVSKVAAKLCTWYFLELKSQKHVTHSREPKATLTQNLHFHLLHPLFVNNSLVKNSNQPGLISELSKRLHGLDYQRLPCGEREQRQSNSAAEPTCFHFHYSLKEQKDVNTPVGRHVTLKKGLKNFSFCSWETEMCCFL